MLENIDNKISGFKSTKKMHESEKSSAYNGLVLSKQVLETYIGEKIENPAKIEMTEAMKSPKIAKAIATNESVSEAAPAKEASLGEALVHTVFTGALTRIDKMQKVFRAGGSLEKTIKQIGGDATKTSALGDVFDDLYYSLEDAHQAAMGHVDEGNSVGVFEDEVGAAETLMASQDMVDSIQGMMEDVGEMINEKLPPLTDSIRRSSGSDAATGFNQQTSSALNALMEAVRAAREAMAGAVATLSGEEQPIAMGSEEEFDLDTSADPEEVAVDDFETSDAAVGGDEPLGRAKRT